jgi:hypothetical protein
MARKLRQRGASISQRRSGPARGLHVSLIHLAKPQSRSSDLNGFCLCFLAALRGVTHSFLLLCGSEPNFSRKGQLTAVCMFVCALIIIGLAVTGVLQLRWEARSPVPHVVAK